MRFCLALWNLHWSAVFIMVLIFFCFMWLIYSTLLRQFLIAADASVNTYSLQECLAIRSIKLLTSSPSVCVATNCKCYRSKNEITEKLTFSSLSDMRMHLHPFATTSSSLSYPINCRRSLILEGVLAYRLTPSSSLRQLVRHLTVSLR